MQSPCTTNVPTLIRVSRPVGLKEAAIDSPTSRSTVIHFSEQVELIERWLDEYVKATNRLVTESISLETVVNNFTSHAVLPISISESVVDHDYTTLAMKKNAECAKDYWMSMITSMKRLTSLVVEPIRNFLINDVRAFKEVRRNLEAAQRNFDSYHTKYAGLGKTKEPSSLREEAFQLYEARKVYLRSLMDFAYIAPQFRFSLDKLLIRVFSDQYKDMKMSRENAATTLHRNAHDMERIQGWIHEMEESEKSFRRELSAARKQLEESADSSHRPSRELEDYAISTAPHMGSMSTSALQRSPRRPGVSSGEMHGWLYLRTYTGRPTRVQWVKRWAFVRNGIFGFLILASRPGSVEESERIGVLLCSARPAPSEERRFCFEIKTNRNSILLQAETQTELSSWLKTFEVAKSKALENPAASDTLAGPGHAHSDPAFAISAPPIPEFGSTILPLLDPSSSEDAAGLERAGTLPVPSGELSRESTDLNRRSTGPLGDDTGREHSSRIMSKFETLRKSSANPQSGSPITPTASGGIASLIAASHGSMPVGPGLSIVHSEPEQTRPKTAFRLAPRDMPPSTLAPSTLVSPPAPTNMSKTAVVVTGERGITASTEKVGMPNGILANTWGSTVQGFVNRLSKADKDGRLPPPSPLVLPSGSPAAGLAVIHPKGQADIISMSSLDLSSLPQPSRSRTPSPEKRHRNTITLEGDVAKQTRLALSIPDYPNYYPLQLKTQDAQFRLLFPSAEQDERLVLVFRASWDPNNDQDFPGRVYVTAKNIYFYSNHLGLVLTSSVPLATIEEVTAAPGRDADFLYLHMTETSADWAATRITIKTFLEPLRLLQRRLSFLAKDSTTDVPMDLENIVKTLLKMESEAPERSPSLESWEEVAPDTPVDGRAQRSRNRGSTTTSVFRVPTRVDRTLGAPDAGGISGLTEKPKFRLPAHPVLHTPSGNLREAVSKQFDVSPKALFHVLFGDKSAVWQLLQHERKAQNLRQGPWIDIGEGRLRREFQFFIPVADSLGRDQLTDVTDYQVVDVNSDHLCYVVTDKRTAWHLPYRHSFRLVSKIVITHVTKGRCKLAVFTKVEWKQAPWLSRLKNIIEGQALNDLELDALDLVDVVGDQVRRLGAHSQTKKAVQVFGQLGQSNETIQFEINNLALNIELRRVPVERRAIDLIWQELQTAFQNALGTVLTCLFSILKWIYNTCQAHYILIAALLISSLLNGWHGSRDALDWYHERQAGKFMSRLGVSPNHVMSKAVHLDDLHELLTQQSNVPTVDQSACYTVFHDSYQLSDLDAPSSSWKSTSTSRHPSQTMRRARQRLGTYRHDLLVAMRVVNSVEKELLLSEWEHWVEDENRRCRQVVGMLPQANLNVTEIEGDVDVSPETDTKELRDWYDDYCASCRVEREKLGV